MSITKTDTVKKRKADVILLSVLAGIGLLIAAFAFLNGRTGTYVQVRVSGQVVRTLPLSTDTEYLIEGAGGTNLLIIRDGAAWIAETDCPDRLCAGMGRIRLRGQSVVCLPHQVVAEITGEPEDGIDIFAG